MCAADGGEATGYQELSGDTPSAVLMLKNKVHVLVHVVPTLALVDTGTTMSVMSVSFKNFSVKVMFTLCDGAMFRGVSSDTVCHLVVCTVGVSLCGCVSHRVRGYCPITHDGHGFFVGVWSNR